MQGSTGFAGWAIFHMPLFRFCAPKPALALILAILKCIVSSHGSIDLLRQPKPWLVVVLPSASHPGSLRMYIIQLLVCLADGRGAPCVLRRLALPRASVAGAILARNAGGVTASRSLGFPSKRAVACVRSSDSAPYATPG